MEEKWCVYVAKKLSTGTDKRPEALSECQKKGGDLMVLDDHEKLRAISRHLHSQSTTETVSFPYWISGTKASGVWKWDNGSPMNLQSHLWAPYEPQSGAGSEGYKYVQLQARGTSKRHYLISERSSSIAYGYICEKLSDGRTR